MTVYDYLCTHELFRPPVKAAGAPPETMAQVLAVGFAWALCVWLAYILISRPGRMLVGDWLVRRGIRAGKKEDELSRLFEEKDRRGGLLSGMCLMGGLLLCTALFSWFFAEVCAADTPGMRQTYLSFANVFLVVSLVMLIECLAARCLFENGKRRYALAHTTTTSEELSPRPAPQGGGQDEQRCRELVTENMLRFLESGGTEDLQALRESQGTLAAWLCEKGQYDEAAVQYERMTTIDEYLVRIGRRGPDLLNAVDDYLRLGGVLSGQALNGDPIKPYTRALELADMLKKEAPAAGAPRACMANYAIACALWRQGRYDESLIRYCLAVRGGLAGARRLAGAGLCPEEPTGMNSCFASVAGALDMPGGGVLAAWEAVIRGGVLPEGDGSTDDLARLADYLDAVAAALMALGDTRGAIGEYRRSVFWVRTAILHRRSRQDHEALYKALMALADALDAEDNGEDGALMRKLALRLKKDELEEDEKY